MTSDLLKKQQQVGRILRKPSGPIEITNIADMVDPNDSEQRTYRQINNAMVHTLKLGDLVELENGIRLFVTQQTRDCNGTPLYNLGIRGDESDVFGYSLRKLIKVLR